MGQTCFSAIVRCSIRAGRPLMNRAFLESFLIQNRESDRGAYRFSCDFCSDNFSAWTENFKSPSACFHGVIMIFFLEKATVV